MTTTFERDGHTYQVTQIENTNFAVAVRDNRRVSVEFPVAVLKMGDWQDQIVESFEGV